MLALLVPVRDVLLDRATIARCIALFLLGAAAVLGSSQILIPLVFVAVYALPYFDAAEPAQRLRMLWRGSVIAAILAVPTVIAFIGRLQILKKKMDFSGLIDGSFFTNMALFVKAKVGFDKYSTTLLVILILFFFGRFLYRRFKSAAPRRALAWPVFLFVLVLCGLASPKGAFTPASTPVWIAGLALFGAYALYLHLAAGRPQRSLEASAAWALALSGMSMLAFYVFQVGVGRRWGISTVLAYYYVMFPLAGCWLAGAGFVALGAAAAPGTARADGWLPRTPAAWAVTAGLVLVFAYSVQMYFPTPAYVRGVVAQKEFLRDIGQAACAEARQAAPGERLFVRARMSLERCPECAALLQSHENFLELMAQNNTTTGGGFQELSIISARHLCPDLAGRLSPLAAQATRSVDSSSKESERFYRKYFR